MKPTENGIALEFQLAITGRVTLRPKQLTLLEVAAVFPTMTDKTSIKYKPDITQIQIESKPRQVAVKTAYSETDGHLSGQPTSRSGGLLPTGR